jgi:hypothetical protein
MKEKGKKRNNRRLYPDDIIQEGDSSPFQQKSGSPGKGKKKKAILKKNEIIWEETSAVHEDDEGDEPDEDEDDSHPSLNEDNNVNHSIDVSDGRCCIERMNWLSYQPEFVWQGESIMDDNQPDPYQQADYYFYRENEEMFEENLVIPFLSSIILSPTLLTLIFLIIVKAFTIITYIGYEAIAYDPIEMEESCGFEEENITEDLPAV